MRDGLAIQPRRKLRISERGKGLSDLGVLDPIVVDDEPLEQRLVPLAAQVPRCLQVGALAVGEQVECLAQSCLDVAEGRLRGFKVLLGLGGLGAKPILLLAQEVNRHGPGVVGMEQLLALLAELGEAPPLTYGLGSGLLTHPG